MKTLHNTAHAMATLRIVCEMIMAFLPGSKYLYIAATRTQEDVPNLWQVELAVTVLSALDCRQ